ncbi:Hsp70 family protein [Calycomorphotria hydatis]|uniref:Chaperone protein DnaK n=1 Tax=Calycomorphotria hydatis TaxID=2528027 RepID=A0A517TAW6_9PLAN|nr:Hsp70 family protein [Calycomorphotria hydatis]QDT65515.1 Chaperone protein DnaK [Calycomorphotria hydatis]
MEFAAGQTVGIDLGTTYSAVARLNDEGIPEVIPNADDRSITPSVILLGEEGHVMVGPSFERISIEDPNNIVEAVKRQMGNDEYFVVYQGKRLTAEFLSALILKKLRQDTEARIGPVGNAVITVPYYFNDVRRKATQDAGTVAGLNVIDIINEPTAATLTYAWEKGELGRTDIAADPKTILVYDLGGGTFDVTVVQYTPTHFKVLATDGDVMLGGLDWSNRLVDHLAEQFMRKFGDDPREDPEAMRTFFQECEDAKRSLSNQGQTPVNVYHKGNTLTVSLTREDFERMTSDLLQRTYDTTSLVIQQAEVDPKTLDEVLLIGGSTYMPIVENMLKDICGRIPSRELLPEAAVAQGAAIHAAILEAKQAGGEGRMADAVIKRLSAVNTVDVNSHSLGVKISASHDRTQKVNHIMIPRNTPLPFTKRQRFVTNVDNQQKVHIYILEGEAEDPDACSPIGDFVVTELPKGLPKGSPVDVEYSYDANGRIHANAVEVKGQNAAKTEIVRDSGLDVDGMAAFMALAETYTVD